MALLSKTYADEPRELVAQYRLFERAILEHVAAEEELILPAYAEAAPLDAKELASEHAAIRNALIKVGVEVELHVVRAHTVAALVRVLRAHAAREDRAMYPWAQVHLSAPARGQLIARIGDSLRVLVTKRAVRVAE